MKNSEGTASPKARFDAAKLSLPGWQLHSKRPAEFRGDGDSTQFSIWVTEGTQRYTREVTAVGIEVHEVASPSEARRLAVQLANQTQIAAIVQSVTIGDIGYAGPEGIPVVFSRGPFAAVVVQAERASIPALDIARTLDAHLAELANPTPTNVE